MSRLNTNDFDFTLDIDPEAYLHRTIEVLDGFFARRWLSLRVVRRLAFATLIIRLTRGCG